MANANSNVQIHIPLDAADQLLGLTIPQVPVKQMPTPARTIVPNTASASSASLLPAVGAPQGAIQSPVTIPEAEQSALGRIPSALAETQPKPWSELGGAGKVGRVFKDIAIGAGTEFAPRIMPFIPGTPQNALMRLGAQTQTLGALGTQGVKEAQVPVLQAQVPSIEAGTALTKAKVPLTEAQAAATKSTGQLTQEHADILRRAADIMSDPAFQKAFQNLGAPGETVAQAGQDFGKIAFSPLGLTPETAPLVSGAGRELAARLEAGRTQKVAGILNGQLTYANYSPYTQQYTIGGKEEPDFQPMPPSSLVPHYEPTVGFDPTTQTFVPSIFNTRYGTTTQAPPGTPATVPTNAMGEISKDMEAAREADTRLNVMLQNEQDALNGINKGKPDQQAEISLLANHIGMTLGLQKGARINQATWKEAESSRPWLSGIKAKFGSDGYLSGVTLTPDQIKQMVNLSRERRYWQWQQAAQAARNYGIPLNIPQVAGPQPTGVEQSAQSPSEYTNLQTNGTITIGEKNGKWYNTKTGKEYK